MGTYIRGDYIGYQKISVADKHNRLSNKTLLKVVKIYANADHTAILVAFEDALNCLLVLLFK